MRRREFIRLLGSAIAWPCCASGQQQMVPVIGYLYAGSPEGSPYHVPAFLKGLSEVGYIEGRNVVIEYRWARNDGRLLPELAADLVQRGVTVIAVPGSMGAALAAKSATSTIPIVFSNAADPVQAGLVASLNRPGGNITGISDQGIGLSAKRLALLRELLPKAQRLTVLVNPINPSATLVAEVQAAASALSMQIDLFAAKTPSEIDNAFADIEQRKSDALWVSTGSLFYNRRVQIVTLAARHAIPTIYPFRDFVDVGGLMSYGSSLADRNRQAGIYVGRILKGEKPADLPIMQASVFELVINRQTASILGISIPTSLLVQADQVVE